VAEAICDTSPHYYLHQAGVFRWLGARFGGIWVPRAVATKLAQGGRRGYRVPLLADLPWVQLKDPSTIPPDWLVLDLGPRGACRHGPRPGVPGSYLASG